MVDLPPVAVLAEQSGQLARAGGSGSVLVLAHVMLRPASGADRRQLSPASEDPGGALQQSGRNTANALTCCPPMRVLARPRGQSALHIAVIWRRLWPGPEAYGGAGAVLL